jgi:hypothetical protein
MATDNSKSRQLYEVAVLHRDPENKGETTVVFQSHEVLAKDAEHAKVQVIRKLDEAYDDKLDELEFKIRPF